MANKTDLIAKVAELAEVSKKDAGVQVDTVINAIGELLIATGEVSVPQFGKFTVQERAARLATNPQDPTGAKVEVAAKKVAKFKPAGGKEGLATLVNS